MMQQNFLKRLLDLSKRTGDRIVFADIEGGEAHVVLSLDDYEKLVLDSPTGRGETLAEPKMTVSDYNNSSALEEISREVVKTLEAESKAGGRGMNLAQGDDLNIEPEERYYLEPLE